MGNRGIKQGMEFVPLEYRDAFRAVSKAHLADVVWSLAGRLTDSADLLEGVFAKACEESDRVAFDRGDVSLSKADDRFKASIERQEALAQEPR